MERMWKMCRKTTQLSCCSRVDYFMDSFFFNTDFFFMDRKSTETIEPFSSPRVNVCNHKGSRQISWTILACHTHIVRPKIHLSVSSKCKFQPGRPKFQPGCIFLQLCWNFNNQS